jgi:predicted AlkP superfamily pyrophosphatase or phosphodiesterase
MTGRVQGPSNLSGILPRGGTAVEPGRLHKLSFLTLMAALLLLACARSGAAESPATRVNAPDQRDKPYLVLVSIDGFRWDFAERFEAAHIASIGARGLQADALRPVFPTLTFPNHYSIATGRNPAAHGLVANQFPNRDRSAWYHYKDRTTVQDGDWYLAEPIWVTAERNGMLTAAYYFVGTEADVAGIHPTHWRAFDANVEGGQRVRQVLDWLAQPPESRPHLITLYFEDVDDNTHWHGIGSPESRAAIRRVDDQVGQLLRGIEALPHGDRVYVLLVSDHGMAAYREDREPLSLDRIVDLSGTRAVEGGPYVFLWFDGDEAHRAESIRDAINEAWDCGRVMLPEDAPESWNVRPGGRFPDLIVLADPGCAVITTMEARRKITPADHGWDPGAPEMRGIFHAMGPRIPAGLRPGEVSVTEIHGLMMSILELPGDDRVDGPGGRLAGLLSPPPEGQALVPEPDSCQNGHFLAGEWRPE